MCKQIFTAHTYIVYRVNSNHKQKLMSLYHYSFVPKPQPYYGSCQQFIGCRIQHFSTTTITCTPYIVGVLYMYM